jgi:TP901 family phage tail tape measure protein
MADVNLGNIFYSILAKDLTKAGTESAKGNFAAANLAIGAAVTAVSGAGVAMIDQNKKLMATMETTALETNISAQTLRNLALELSNGQDSITEVSGAMQILGKYNVTTAEQMRIATDAALALGDANKVSADVAANSVIPALQAYGLTVDDLGAKSDQLTTITHTTKYALTDITNVLARTAPEAAAAGLSFDDMTSIIEALGQKGIPTRQVVNEINTAIKGMNTNVTEASKAVKQAETDLEGYQDEITKNKQSLTEYAYKQTQLNREVRDATNQYAAGKIGLRDYQEKMADLRQTASEYAFDITELKEKNTELQQKVRDTTSTLETNQKTLKDTKITAADLSKALGITADQTNKAKAAMDAGTGSTKKFDEIAKANVGTMANLANWWEKTTDNVGQALTPYSGMFQMTTALGGAVTVLNGVLVLNEALNISGAAAKYAHAAATGVITAATWLFNAALDANPLGVIVIAALALVGAIAALDSQFHFIQPTMQFLADAFGVIWQYLMYCVQGMGLLGQAILNTPAISSLITLISQASGLIAGATSGPAVSSPGPATPATVTASQQTNTPLPAIKKSGDLHIHLKDGTTETVTAVISPEDDSLSRQSMGYRT